MFKGKKINKDERWERKNIKWNVTLREWRKGKKVIPDKSTRHNREKSYWKDIFFLIEIAASPDKKKSLANVFETK